MNHSLVPIAANLFAVDANEVKSPLEPNVKCQSRVEIFSAVSCVLHI